ncbi:MAG: PAS domain-containing sensor histidine kinase [Burkholderiaceae bacterium]
MSVDLLARIADRIPSMLAYWDRELRCLFANRAYHDWFGVEPESLIGSTLPRLLGPELFALNEPYVKGVLAGVEQRFERDVPGPAGVRRSLACYLPDRQDGHVVGFIAYVTDVTPLKLAQDRLRAARRRTALAARDLRRRAANLREAQRVAQVGSWEWRMAGDSVAWSDELCRLFGLDPKHPPPPYAAQGQLFLPESWRLLQQAVAATLADGTPYELELEFRHPDGSTHWIEARGEALRDGAGRIVGLRGTAHDITWRRRLDAARVSAEVAEAANRNKTELLSRAGHELRTPLNAILGFGQLLQQAEMQPLQRQWLDRIVDSGRHMLLLTNDLLDLSAAESGRLSISVETVDLAEIAARACQAMEQQAQRAAMRIELKPVAAQRRLVRADSVRVRQIVTNLLSNAIKYGRADTVVDVSIDDAPPGMRSLHVQDAGPGLTPVQLSLLFTPFERLGAQRTSVQGLGLGLALSRQLAELMNGRIEVSSEPGVGSCFTLVLPAATD